MRVDRSGLVGLRPAHHDAVGSLFHHMQIQIRVGRLRLAPFAGFNPNPFR
jgi:hypothetical protein